MRHEAGRWVFLLVVVTCLVALVIWARGPVHHHGRYVGALGGQHVAAATFDGA